MEIEIRLNKVSIQAIAQLELLFGEGIKITQFNCEQKLFNATISNTRMRERELFELTEMSMRDLLGIIKEKNDYNKEYIQELIHKSVEELNLSVRSSNGLKNAQIKLIGELASKTDKELLKIQNFAKKCLNEVKSSLGDFNLTLGMKFENFPDSKIIQQIESEQ